MRNIFNNNRRTESENNLESLTTYPRDYFIEYSTGGDDEPILFI